MNQDNERIILGGSEEVTLTECGAVLRAKVDTGAWTGALHCTNIYEQDGALCYTPLGKEEYATSTATYEKRVVKSASGHASQRYIVPITLEIQGKTYHTNVGLTDRSALQRDMLLGRKFLIENNMLVDVSLTRDQDYEAERYL